MRGKFNGIPVEVISTVAGHAGAVPAVIGDFRVTEDYEHPKVKGMLNVSKPLRRGERFKGNMKHFVPTD